MVRQARCNLFSNESIAPTASVTSASISIEKSTGFFAITGTMSGTSPDIQIEYLVGDGTNFVAGSAPIVTGQTSSPIHVQFSPDLSEYLQIKVTNNAASSVTLSLQLIFTE